MTDYENEYQNEIASEEETENGVTAYKGEDINATTEEIILCSLINNADFLSKTITYFVDDIFEEDKYAAIFEEIKNWYNKYSSKPDFVSLKHDVLEKAKKHRNANLKNDVLEVFNTLRSLEIEESKWLYETTEEWIRRRRIHMALLTSISVYQGDNKKVYIGEVPRILEDAISVSFDTEIGMEWFKDADKRYEYYTSPIHRVPTGITILDHRTGGGIPKKTLNGLISSTNVGKTMMMCALAVEYMRQGYDVLYITLEMREEEILKRIDANLLDIPLEKFVNLDKDTFFSKINRLNEKHLGKLIVKEYGAHTCSVHTLRRIFKEITTKSLGKKPSVIMMDYMGLMKSTRLSPGQSKTHEYQKSISEELRGFMLEEDVFCWTGIQTNRSGVNSTEIDLDQIADSYAIATTLDYCLSMWSTPEGERENLIYMKEVKSRYGNKATCPTLVIGVDKERQRIFDASGYNLEVVQREHLSKPLNEDRQDNINAKLFSSLK